MATTPKRPGEDGQDVARTAACSSTDLRGGLRLPLSAGVVKSCYACVRIYHSHELCECTFDTHLVTWP